MWLGNNVAVNSLLTTTKPITFLSFFCNLFPFHSFFPTATHSKSCFWHFCGQVSFNPISCCSFGAPHSCADSWSVPQNRKWTSLWSFSSQIGLVFLCAIIWHSNLLLLTITSPHPLIRVWCGMHRRKGIQVFCSL